MFYRDVEKFIAATLSSDELPVSPAYGHEITDEVRDCVVALAGGEKDFADYIAFDINVQIRTSQECDPERALLFNLTDKMHDKIVRLNLNISGVTENFDSVEGWNTATINFKWHDRYGNND